MLGAPSFHVGESGVPVVAWFGVPASATVMIFWEVAAVGPAVIRVVVATLGSGWARASCGATSWRLRWGLRLCGKGLCDGLLDQCGDVGGGSDNTRAGDDAWYGRGVRDGGRAGCQVLLQAFNEERQLVIFGLSGRA